MHALAELDTGSFDRLTAALEAVPERLTSKRLADRIANELPEGARDSSLTMLESVLSLMRLLGESGDRADELAIDVSQSEDLDIDDELREQVADRMKKLLRLEALVVAARAYDLSAELERGFHDARIVTDIRPVFGPSVDDGVRAAEIVSTLKVQYHTAEGPLESVFFGLDRGDLVRLQDVVDRALKKVQSLEQLVSRMDLPYWEYREAEEGTDAATS